MNEDLKNETEAALGENKPQKDYTLPASIVFAALIIGGSWIYTAGLKYPGLASVGTKVASEVSTGGLEEKVLPSEGVTLPIRWGDLGMQMVSAGVIDAEKFAELYAGRGGLDAETKSLLSGGNGESVKITPENSGTMLNLLWAFGLANKNPVLEAGPMMDPRYGGADRFASTAGWTLSRGDSMAHYSRHSFVTLTPEQQKLVERVSQGIYRPCCGNSTYFPDCNHGMAMLGLLELMAANGVGEDEMYRVALQVNSYWFPDTYLTIANYLASRGIDWSEATPKEVLGADFSSASGYQKVLTEIQPVERQSGGGCGV